MPRMLTTKDSITFAHFRFDERVANTSTYSMTSQFIHKFRHAFGDNQIVEDGRTGELVEQAIGNHRCDLGTVNQIAVLIDGEHAISITIKGRTYVRAGLAYLLLNINHVLRLNGAGLVMGETAIKLKVQRNEFTG